MRSLLLAALLVHTASAEPLPSGALELTGGAVSGAGADAKRLGAGYAFGGQASWQPTKTERHWGITLRSALLITQQFGGSAAQVDSTLRTVQMDFSAGLRLRPWVTPTRWFTLRGGAEILRTNEPLPPSMSQRAFLGPIASIGLDQYLGKIMFSVDVRYGMIGNGPDQLALLIGIGPTGP